MYQLLNTFLELFEHFRELHCSYETIFRRDSCYRANWNQRWKPTGAKSIGKRKRLANEKGRKGRYWEGRGGGREGHLYSAGGIASALHSNDAPEKSNAVVSRSGPTELMVGGSTVKTRSNIHLSVDRLFVDNRNKRRNALARESSYRGFYIPVFSARELLGTAGKPGRYLLAVVSVLNRSETIKRAACQRVTGDASMVIVVSGSIVFTRAT